MKKKSAFLTWFEAQFGKRCVPHGEDLVLIRTANDGDKAKMLLDQAREYDRQFEAALYAWNVKDGEK